MAQQDERAKLETYPTIHFPLDTGELDVSQQDEQEQLGAYSQAQPGMVTEWGPYQTIHIVP